MPTGEPRARELRDRPLFAVFVIALLILAIFLVSRGCQREGIELTQDEAIAIAREQVTFVPDRIAVRFIRQGLSFQPHWAVSLSEETPEGLANITVVLVDAETGEVVDIRRP